MAFFKICADVSDMSLGIFFPKGLGSGAALANVPPLIAFPCCGVVMGFGDRDFDGFHFRVGAQ